MSLATHCIPWDEDCTICNPPPRQNPDDAHPTPDSQITPLDETTEQIITSFERWPVTERRNALRSRIRELVEEARKEGSVPPINIPVLRGGGEFTR